MTVEVVQPQDLGKGIKKNDDSKQFDVDLTDYVDGTSVVFSNGKLSAVAGDAQPQSERIVTLSNFRFSSTSSISGQQSGIVTATMKSKDGLFSNETDVSSTWQYYGGNVFVAGFTFALQSDSGETSYYEIAPYSVHVNNHTNNLDRYVRVFKSEL